MKLPSKALKDWCHHIQELATRTSRRGDGFCACEVCGAIQHAPADQQAQLASGLFWTVWIDQVLYWTLIDAKAGVAKDQGFHERFRVAYPFPKLHAHSGDGNAPPFIILSADHARSLGVKSARMPSRELLREDKSEFWDKEVAQWLEDNGRQDVRMAAECAFREDLSQRPSQEWQFLAELFPAA